jgi:hypothetical protein
MQRLLILAAAASIAACHSRTEDQAGAAPEQGRADTAGVTHVIDTARTGPPGVGGRPADATVTLDSVVGDSAAAQAGAQADTSAAGAGQPPVSTPQDTLGPRDLETGAADTTGGAEQTPPAGAEQTGGDTTGAWTGGDTVGVDTTGGAAGGADTTGAPRQ